MRFTKLEALGNDFVVFGPEDPPGPEWIARIAPAICDRRHGVGADGVLRCEWHRPGIELRIWNADGSETMACGNAVRAVVAWRTQEGETWTERMPLRVTTLDGLRRAWAVADRLDTYGSDLGVPRGLFGKPLSAPLTFTHEGVEVRVQAVDMGNPHGIVFVSDLETAPLSALAASVRASGHFPDGVNVSLVTVRGPGQLAQRVDERGVGPTPACGTGAAAAVVAAALAGHGHGPWEVQQPGGTLRASWPGPGEGVEVEGPARVASRARGRRRLPSDHEGPRRQSARRRAATGGAAGHERFRPQDRASALIRPGSVSAVD